MGINQLRPTGIDLSTEGWTGFLATGIEFTNGSILLVAMRSLGVSPAIGRVETSTDADQIFGGNSLRSTTRLKQLKPPLRYSSQQHITELKSANDLGSLWDQGPAYDLSKDDPLDY
jgi:hypothetical protein